MKRFLSVFVGVLVFGLVPISDAETVAVTAVGKITAVKSAMTAVAKVGAEKSMKHETAPAAKSATTGQTPVRPKPPFVEGQNVPEVYLGLSKGMRASYGLHFFTPLPYPMAEYEDSLEVREYGTVVNYAGQQVYYVLLTPKIGVQLPFNEAAAYYCFDYTESEYDGLQAYLYKITDFWIKTDTDRQRLYEAPNECSRPMEPVAFW